MIRHWHERDAVAGFGPESAPSPTYVASFDAACRTLEMLGARLVDLHVSPLLDFADANRVIMMAEAYALHESDFRERPHLFGRHMFARIGLGAFLSAADYIEAVRQRRELCAEMAEALAASTCGLSQRNRPGAADRRGRDLRDLPARLVYGAVQHNRAAGDIGADRVRGWAAAGLPDRGETVRRSRRIARRIRL